MFLSPLLKLRKNDGEMNSLSTILLQFSWLKIGMLKGGQTIRASDQNLFESYRLS